jgi:hypothetical protein
MTGPRIRQWRLWTRPGTTAETQLPRRHALAGEDGREALLARLPVVELLRRAGFECGLVTVNRWPVLPTSRSRLAP